MKTEEGTDVPGSIEAVVERARLLKEESPEDMGFTIIAFVDGEEAASVQVFTEDLKDVVKAAEHVLTSLYVEELIVMADTYHALVDTNPITGESWGPDEVSYAANNYDDIEKGWVEEAVSLSYLSRDGEVIKRMSVLGAIGYTTKEDGIEWSDELKLVLRDDNAAPHSAANGLSDRLRELMDSERFRPATSFLHMLEDPDADFPEWADRQALEQVRATKNAIMALLRMISADKKDVSEKQLNRTLDKLFLAFLFDTHYDPPHKLTLMFDNDAEKEILSRMSGKKLGEVGATGMTVVSNVDVR